MQYATHPMHHRPSDHVPAFSLPFFEILATVLFYTANDEWTELELKEEEKICKIYQNVTILNRFIHMKNYKTNS